MDERILLAVAQRLRADELQSQPAVVARQNLRGRPEPLDMEPPVLLEGRSLEQGMIQVIVRAPPIAAAASASRGSASSPFRHAPRRRASRGAARTPPAGCPPRRTGPYRAPRPVCAIRSATSRGLNSTPPNPPVCAAAIASSSSRAFTPIGRRTQRGIHCSCSPSTLQLVASVVDPITPHHLTTSSTSHIPLCLCATSAAGGLLSASPRSPPPAFAGIRGTPP